MSPKYPAGLSIPSILPYWRTSFTSTQSPTSVTTLRSRCQHGKCSNSSFRLCVLTPSRIRSLLVRRILRLVARLCANLNLAGPGCGRSKALPSNCKYGITIDTLMFVGHPEPFRSDVCLSTAFGIGPEAHRDIPQY